MASNNTKRGCIGAVGCVVFGGIAALLGSVLALHLVGVAMNARPIVLPPLDADWHVTRDFVRTDGGAPEAAALRTAVHTQCRPSKNGIRVLYNWVWYNTLTSGYETRLWVEKGDYDSQFALYLWSNQAILRHTAPPYGSQLIVCDLDVSDWNALAAP